MVFSNLIFRMMKGMVLLCLFPVLGNAQDYVPGELIVKLKGKSTSLMSNAFVGKAHLEKQMSLKKSFNRLNVHHFALKPGQNVEAMVRQLEADPQVEYAEPNYILKKASVDEEISQQRYNQKQIQSLVTEGSSGHSKADTGVVEAWSALSASDSRPIVAVIDTGVDIDHYVFQDSNAIWTNENEIPNNGVDDDGNGFVDDVHGWNFYANTNDPFDDDGHGTHVTGIILGVGQDIFESSLEESKVQIMPLKFLGADGTGSTADAIKAIYYAIENGAVVLNNSWGGGNYSVALHEAVTYSYERSVAFVAAAGNFSSNNDQAPLYPASFDVPHVMAIAATNDWDSLASFSNFGSESVDVGGPGVAILSTYPGNVFGYSSGTSMSSPFVAGVAALMMRENDQLSGYQVRSLLFSSSKNVSALSGKISTGSQVNVEQAVLTAKSGQLPDEAPAYSLSGSRDLASEGVQGGCGLVSAVGGSGGFPGGIVLGLLLLMPLLVVKLRREKKSTPSRRRYTRYDIESSVTVNIGGKEVVGKVSSISEGGVKLDTEAMIESGGIVSMTIASPDGQNQIQVQGQVVWKDTSKSYGVQFQRVERSARETITNWTKQLLPSAN